MHQLTTPEQLFSALVSGSPARPFVTYYDESTGERVELSVQSLGNWVAKTHFLLTDELGLGVGDAALIDLPAHWISVPCLLGALTAGLSLTEDPAQAAVAFVSDPSAADGVPDVYTVALTVTAVAGDYVTAVRPQADAWPTVHPPAMDTDACLDGRSRGEAVEWARSRAAALGVGEGVRALSTREWHGTADWVDTLFVPLVVGGSVVYVRNAPSEDVVARRMTQERASVRI